MRMRRRTRTRTRIKQPRGWFSENKSNNWGFRALTVRVWERFIYFGGYHKLVI